MNPKIIISALFLLAISVFSLRADVAPPPGYTKVNVSIVLEVTEDFPDYRFFLVSGNLVKEIFFKKNEKTTVGSLGGGARYNSGNVVAIPRKSLISFGENPAGEKLKAFETAVSDWGSIAGSIKLISHSFGREVKDADAHNVPDTAYRIEKTADGPTASPLKTDEKKQGGSGGPSFGTYDIQKSLTPLGWTVIAGVAFGGLILLIFGVLKVFGSFKKHA